MYLSKPCVALFGNEGEVVDGDVQPEGQPEGQSRQFSQDELNAYVASEKRKWQSKTLESERAALEATRRAEELQLQLDKATLSSDEFHRKELSKQSAAYEEKLTTANQRVASLENTIKNRDFESAVSAACLTHDAISVSQITAILRAKGQIEHTDDGPCVRNGEELIPVGAAVAGLIESNPNLFKPRGVSGVGAGANNGAHAGLGKPLNVKNLPMDQYLKIRKEHPELLGLRRKK